MGCDIYNHTELLIQHTEKNVTLDAIIVLSTDKIYLQGLQNEEKYKHENFLEKDFSWTLPYLIYHNHKFIDIEYEEKYSRRKLCSDKVEMFSIEL